MNRGDILVCEELDPTDILVRGQVEPQSSMNTPTSKNMDQEVCVTRHQAIDQDRMFLLDRQLVQVEDVFEDDDLVLDLGGGGEGVIGQLRGRQVVAIDTRRQELEECAPGPLKIVADAKELPFLDGVFDVITAFFFLMYVPASERPRVFKEAHRVLRPGGSFHIWDVEIPPREGTTQDVLAVPVKVEIPGKTIETGYGTTWDDHEMCADTIGRMAEDAGFIVEQRKLHGASFRLVLARGSI